MVLSALAIAAPASAEFKGAAPLAWRWVQPTSIPPGSPTVVGDVVYTAVGRRVYALDRATGNQIWRFPVGEPNASNFQFGTLVSGDTVFATSQDRVVFALDAKTGKQKWQYTADQGLLSAPVLAANTLVLPLADNSLLAVEVNSGTQFWTNPTRIFAGIRGSLSSFNDAVLVFDQANKLYSIDTATKRTNWEIGLTEINSNVTITMFENTAYFVSGTFVVGLNPANGRRAGQIFNFNERLAYSPAVSTNSVAAVTAEGRLMVADKLNPRSMKRFDLGAQAVSGPEFLGNYISVNLANGSMIVIDPATGKTVWNYILRPAVKPTATTSGGSGTAASSTPPNFMTAVGGPMMAGGSVLLQSRDGSLLSFDPVNGVDLTPPDVKLLFPFAGSEMNPRYGRTQNNQRTLADFVTVFFQMDDQGSGLDMSGVKVTGNGRPMKVITTRDGIAAVRLEESENRFATSGRVVFEVTARDWMGNESKQQYTITFDASVPPIDQPGSASGNTGTGGAGGGRPGDGRDG